MLSLDMADSRFKCYAFLRKIIYFSANTSLFYTETSISQAWVLNKLKLKAPVGLAILSAA